ncbi:MAG TPA: zinc ribbon domain-containing protein, partial [Candidatus Hydrogenedentes bacterium]|nr:zinc ribbon domain-containing protein [Candidatus Hydrogenedentota bacterium]
MINCPYCGKLTDPKLANCPHCGGPMHAKAPSAPRGAGAKPQQHCPSCGAAVHDGMIICVQCGTNLLTGHKIAEERKAPPVRERRRWPLFVGFAVVVVALGVLVSQLPAFLKGPVDR